MSCCLEFDRRGGSVILSRRTTDLHFGENEPLVILSAAKDHLATLDPRKKILRCAQDDTAHESRAPISAQFASILLIVMVLASCTRQEPLPKLFPVPDAALVNQDGRSVHLSEYNGYVTVYTFIFTNCAGICPLMTQKMRALVKSVDPDEPVRFVSISVDPVRDTPEALRAYAERVGRDPRWTFLRGEGDTVIELSQKGFKLAAGMEVASGAEPILHSPRFVLADRTGTIRGYYDSQESEDVNNLEADISVLVEE